MTWTPISPVGTKSVRFNTPQMAGNTAYIDATMKVDHYWNSVGLSGHHKFAQMTQMGTPASPTNPAPDAGIDLVYYCKSKTTVESPSQQDVQPFTISNPLAPATAQIMQLLGIRVMAVFHLDNSNPPMPIIDYSHNLTSIVRNSKGVFQANFPLLPSPNYLVLGGSLVKSALVNDLLSFNLDAATALTATKTTTFFKFRTVALNSGFELKDPLQCWFIVFGG